MKPILADAIDLPLVLGFGMAVLVPLMLFQVVVEAFVLSRVWPGNFRDLAGFTFRANCWSLLAGIPTKVCNALIYGWLLPRDIPGFYAAYPGVTILGTLIYFAVTLGVEGLCARRWLQVELPKRQMWRGILLANVATYAVLAPVHYFATRPLTDVKVFTRNASWSRHAETPIVYVDETDGQLKSVRIGGGVPEIIVPARVEDYLLSADKRVCLFLTRAGTLVLYDRASGASNVVWQTEERLRINQVAFSPSAQLVAMASEEERLLHVVRVATGRRSSMKLPADASYWTVAWSADEDRLFLKTGTHSLFSVTLTDEFGLTYANLADTNEVRLLTCYGVVRGQYPFRSECDDRRASAMPGLGSGVRVYRQGESSRDGLAIAVNPGLLHLAAFQFRKVAFLDGCDDLLLEATGGIYLVDLEQRRLGTVVPKGESFTLMSPRFQKRLE